MPDVTSVVQSIAFEASAGDFTVAELIEDLKKFPQDHLVGFQVGDKADSPVFRVAELSTDDLFRIVDFVLEERE